MMYPFTSYHYPGIILVKDQEQGTGHYFSAVPFV